MSGTCSATDGWERIVNPGDQQARIWADPDRRGGRPTIRGMRITVDDIVAYAASGMTMAEILRDFPELDEADVSAALAYVAGEG